MRQKFFNTWEKHFCKLEWHSLQHRICKNSCGNFFNV